MLVKKHRVLNHNFLVLVLITIYKMYMLGNISLDHVEPHRPIFPADPVRLVVGHVSKWIPHKGPALLDTVTRRQSCSAVSQLARCRQLYRNHFEAFVGYYIIRPQFSQYVITKLVFHNFSIKSWLF